MNSQTQTENSSHDNIARLSNLLLNLAGILGIIALVLFILLMLNRF